MLEQILESQLLANPSDALVLARLERFKEVAIIVTGLRDATVQQGALFLETLVNQKNHFLPCLLSNSFECVS